MTTTILRFKQLANRIYFKMKLRQGALADTKEVFSEIYNRKYWGNSESISGGGSTLEYTKNIRKEIPLLLNQLGIKHIYDAPCGDFNWFQNIQWAEPPIYLGADIVEEIIKNNTEQYANSHIKFIQKNIITDAPPNLPSLSIWICRDCLFHLPLESAHAVLEKFLDSGIDYLLTSTHSNVKVNTQINVGDFRLIDLTKSPFNLPPPKHKITDFIGDHAERYLALWSKKEVKSALNS